VCSVVHELWAGDNRPIKGVPIVQIKSGQGNTTDGPGECPLNKSVVLKRRRGPRIPLFRTSAFQWLQWRRITEAACS